MTRIAKGLVGALLPVAAIALVHGCAGGGSNTAQELTTTDTPAITGSTTSANRMPTINRIGDEYARVGETYTFQPIAGDADGDPLMFTATNLPPWASIDGRNGHISGTPGPTDQGVYEAITVIVADATHHAESATFSITVIGDPGTGVATLRWEAPPSKVDGSPLDDLAGYRILYGRTPEDLDNSVLINDPATTSYEFSSLSKGLWYFTVVAVNSGGLEGPPTVVTTKSI
ncbi:MAG TPA: putative Ig domain-containing protein [Steroidobacteraceae bacterium]|nr:putative Ig domain-containing protein [Steroidobacteraceae bacterium]